MRTVHGSGFHDFLQAYAVKRLKDKGLKPKEVRDAIAVSKEEYGLPYPISVKGHRIYVDKKSHKVYIEPPQDKRITRLTGSGKDQVHFTEIIEPYIDLLEFDEAGIAMRLTVYEELLGGIRKRVVMEPSKNFGEPTVEGTPYRVETLRKGC